MVNKLRVALTVGPVGAGGIATYSLELAIALCDRDDVEMVLVGPQAVLDELAASVCPSAMVPLSASRLRSQVQLALIRGAIRDLSCDVVHSTRHVLPLRWRGAAVITFHDDYPVTRRADYDLLKRLILPRVFRWSMRRADAVITLTEATVRDAAALARPSVPVIAAGAGAPTRLTSSTPTAPTNWSRLPERFAVVVGDAGPRKRVGELVDMWQHVDDIHLVVAGGRAASDALRRRLGSASNVSLVEHPTDSELAWLYANAALVIDPSVEEGFGFTRVEAAAFGVPYLALRDAEPSLSWIDRVVAAPESVAPVTTADVASTWADVAEATTQVYRSAVASRVQV